MPKKSKKSRKPSSLIGSTAFRKLYDAALHILTLQPWNYFTSGDFFIQYPKNSERMILACTVNSLTEGFGVLVYPNPAFCPDSILLSDVFVISEKEYIETALYLILTPNTGLFFAYRSIYCGFVGVSEPVHCILSLICRLNLQ